MPSKTLSLKVKVGEVYDGCWEYLGLKDWRYRFRNIYNKRECSIKSKAMKRWEEGKTSLAKAFFQTTPKGRRRAYIVATMMKWRNKNG